MLDGEFTKLLVIAGTLNVSPIFTDAGPERVTAGGGVIVTTDRIDVVAREISLPSSVW